MNKMTTQGDTTVWDALALANVQLADYGQKYPNATTFAKRALELKWIWTPSV